MDNNFSDLFAPKWARQDPASETGKASSRHYSDESSSASAPRTPRRQAPESNSAAPTPAAERRGPPRGEKRGGGFSKPRTIEPLPELTVRFLPTQTALNFVAAKIRSSHKAFPLRDILRLIQNDDSALSVRITAEQELYQCKHCGFPALTEKALFEHISAAHASDEALGTLDATKILTLVRRATEIVVPAAALKGHPDRRLASFLEGKLVEEFKRPAAQSQTSASQPSLHSSVIGALRHRGFNLFRAKSGETRWEFVNTAPLTPFDPTHAVAEIRQIIRFIEEHNPVPRAQLIAELFPDSAESRLAEVNSHLNWLRERGSVIQFFNDLLSLPDHPIFQVKEKK